MYQVRTIGGVMGRDVVLVSSADETAFEVRAVLDGVHEAVGGRVARRAGDRPGRHRFLSSGDIEWFRRQGARLLGPEVAEVEPVRW